MRLLFIHIRTYRRGLDIHIDISGGTSVICPSLNTPVSLDPSSQGPNAGTALAFREYIIKSNFANCKYSSPTIF